VKRFRLFAVLYLSSIVSMASATWPEKPIKIVIGFPAGGPLDQHARLLTDRLQQVLGQNIIVDYKASAGGLVGAQFVATAPADGYTMLLANTDTMVINPALPDTPTLIGKPRSSQSNGDPRR
jgi:tripartite-type tricarboxylate transporter receptor subunit TctC